VIVVVPAVRVRCQLQKRLSSGKKGVSIIITIFNKKKKKKGTRRSGREGGGWTLKTPLKKKNPTHALLSLVNISVDLHRVEL
jgi:hypothetical protein